MPGSRKSVEETSPLAFFFSSFVKLLKSKVEWSRGFGGVELN